MKLTQSVTLIGLTLGLSLCLPIIGTAAQSPTSITLESSVHFTAADGNAVVLESGSYEIQGKGEQLEVRSLADQKTIVLQASKGRHELKIKVPIAISIPGYTEEEADYYYIALLVPGGTSLETTGTYSGIQSRGLFNKPRPGLQQALDKAKQIPQNIKAGAQQLRDRAEQFAHLEKCQLMVNAIKDVRLFPENLARLTEGRVRRNELARWRQSAEIRQQIRDKTTQFLEAHKNLVPELKRIHQWLNNPQNRSAVQDIFSVDTLCKANPADIEAKLTRYGLRPNVAGTASATDNHFYIGLSKGVTAAVVGGVVAGQQIVTDFQGNTMKLITVGPAIVTNATISGTLEVMFYPSTNRAAFGGWSAGLGFSGGTPEVDIGLALDFAFGSTPAILPLAGRVIKEFQGFGLGPTAGLSLIPVDGTNSYAYTWELPWWVP
jgi:hypothetical protein